MATDTFLPEVYEHLERALKRTIRYTDQEELTLMELCLGRGLTKYTPVYSPLPGDARRYDIAAEGIMVLRARNVPPLMTSSEQSSPAANLKPDAEAEFSEPLTSNEYTILQQLARQRPQLIKIVDLAADLNCGRTAASSSVKHLEALKYVERHGERSGIGITKNGLAAIRPCDQPSTF